METASRFSLMTSYSGLWINRRKKGILCQCYKPDVSYFRGVNNQAEIPYTHLRNQYQCEIQEIQIALNVT